MCKSYFGTWVKIREIRVIWPVGLSLPNSSAVCLLILIEFNVRREILKVLEHYANISTTTECGHRSADTNIDHPFIFYTIICAL